MNFLKNVTQFQYVFETTIKENSEDFMNNTSESATRAVEKYTNSIEVMASQSSYSENVNTAQDELPSKESNVQLKNKNIINISKDEEIPKIIEFVDNNKLLLNNNNEIVQNNKRDSVTELTLRKTNEYSVTEIDDFEQVLKEFMIKGDDKLPKYGDMVDIIDGTASNTNEDLVVLNLDEFDDTSNNSKENKTSNDNKSTLAEHNSLDINKMQTLKFRQIRKPKKYSDNETASNTVQITNEYKEIQFQKHDKVEHLEVQSEKIQTLTVYDKQCSVNTSIDIDLTIEKDNRREVDVDATEYQNCIQDNKIEKTLDMSIQNLTNDIQDTSKLKEEFDHNRIISINNDNVAERRDSNNISKLEKDNITMDFVNERDDNIKATSVNEPTDIDTISLLSIEANIENADLEFCNGYHSSDFEFITESDAEIEGFVTNTPKSIEINKKSKTKRVVTSKYASSNKDKPETKKVYINGKIPKYNTNEHFHQPGPSNSKTNSSFTPFNNTYNAANYRQTYTQNTRPNHIIPQGEEYLNLFQGIYAPMFTDLFFLENKSVRAQTCMNIQYEGVGFDFRMPSGEDSAEEYKEEANESVKKILELYPSENRSKRKRPRI